MFVIKLTAIGLQKLAAASTGGPAVSLTHIAIGDGNGNSIPTDPLPAQLVHQVLQKQINALYVNANDPTIMMAEMVIPSDEGGFSIREIAVKDAEGDTFAIGAFPATYKPLAAEGSTRDMIINVAIKVGSAANIQLVIDTSIVLATRPWVLSQVTSAAILPGGLTGQVPYKLSNADGDIGWKNITDAINVSVDAVREIQTTVAGATVYTLAVCTTDGVAVYIEGVRIFDFTVLNTTQLQLSAAYPTTGHQIAFVQNEPNEPLKLRQLVTARAYFMGQM
jgi:phage-related tail fiber protein